MANGEPGDGDQGLDNTPSHGRIYWGGAMYYLLADIHILQQTRGRLGLQDALRAINRKSGGNTAEWTVAQMAAVGDEATGTHVLTTLYTEMGPSPVRVDLDALFASLGVAEKDGAIVFDDTAPLAWIRRRITQPPLA
jgi:predicted metalloprotease with PDZ domain